MLEHKAFIMKMYGICKHLSLCGTLNCSYWTSGEGEVGEEDKDEWVVEEGVVEEGEEEIGREVFVCKEERQPGVSSLKITSREKWYFPWR